MAMKARGLHFSASHFSADALMLPAFENKERSLCPKDH